MTLYAWPHRTLGGGVSREGGEESRKRDGEGRRKGRWRIRGKEEDAEGRRRIGGEDRGVV